MEEIGKWIIMSYNSNSFIMKLFHFVRKSGLFDWPQVWHGRFFLWKKIIFWMIVHLKTIHFYVKISKVKSIKQQNILGFYKVHFCGHLVSYTRLTTKSRLFRRVPIHIPKGFDQRIRGPDELSRGRTSRERVTFFEEIKTSSEWEHSHSPSHNIWWCATSVKV
jgi:hypothetical protein